MTHESSHIILEDWNDFFRKTVSYGESGSKVRLWVLILIPPVLTFVIGVWCF